jgi:hypothetical protein
MSKIIIVSEAHTTERKVLASHDTVSEAVKEKKELIYKGWSNLTLEIMPSEQSVCK